VTASPRTGRSRDTRWFGTLRIETVAAALCLLGATASGGADAAGDRVDLVEGAHRRIVLERSVSRVAVGDPDRVSWTLLNDREILLLGLDTGRSSLLIWFDDGTLRELEVSVQPDLSILQRALGDIHPSISAEMAPDRSALVLRGRVPTIVYARSAEDAGRAWLEAGRSGAPLLGVDDADPDTGAGADTLRPAQVDASGPGRVVNLIQVETLPRLVEERLRDALGARGFEDVRVDRLMAGDVRDDLRDTFVLEGNVATQVDLNRVLHLATYVVLGEGVDPEIEVLGDESGALAREADSVSDSSSFNFNSGSSTQGLFGGGNNTTLQNRIRANLGRATLVSAAGGRVLSLIDVSRLPQVRVDVRLYEVNLTDLRNREAELTLLWGDITQGSLEPAVSATGIQGAQAGRVGDTNPTDWQDALSFLDEGLRNQIQILGDDAALDATFQILETEGIARSLARPSLTVLSGERALFQVGGEIPIPQSFATNEVAEGVFNSVEFRAFGIQLDIRPLVGDDGRITIDLTPQISQPSPELTTLVRDTTGNDQLTTGFETRLLRTSARLRSGDTLVLGGLISQSSEWSESRAPWLAEIPVIGEFFKRRSESSDDLELVLVLHPVVLHEARPRARLWDFGDPEELMRDLLAEIESARNSGNPNRPSGMDPNGG